MMSPAQRFAGDPLQFQGKDVHPQYREDGHVLRYLVVGTKGAAESDLYHRSIKRWVFGDSPQFFTSTLTEKLSWTFEEDQIYGHNTLGQAHDIVHRVARGLPPMTSARDAYESMRICFAAEESADTGQTIQL